MNDLYLNLGPTTGKASKLWFDVLLILGSALALAAVVFLVWAIFFWKTKSRKRSHSRPVPNKLHQAKESPERSPGWFAGRRRRRRRQRSFNQRNATLAETGGLPPVRAKESSPPDPSAGPQEAAS